MIELIPIDEIELDIISKMKKIFKKHPERLKILRQHKEDLMLGNYNAIPDCIPRGLIYPIEVRRIHGEKHKYRVTDGHHRIIIWKYLGFTHIRANVREAKRSRGRKK